MKNKLEMGKVVRPKGLDGTIKCSFALENFKNLKLIKTLFVDDVAYEVLRSYGQNGFACFKLKGLEKIDDAEKLRGKTVEILREESGEDEDQIFVADLVGLNAVDSQGKEYGKIVDVENYGASDILVVKNKTKEFLIPLIPNLIVEANDVTLILDYEILKGLI